MINIHCNSQKGTQVLIKPWKIRGKADFYSVVQGRPWVIFFTAEIAETKDFYAVNVLTVDFTADFYTVNFLTADFFHG